MGYYRKSERNSSSAGASVFTVERLTVERFYNTT